MMSPTPLSCRPSPRQARALAEHRQRQLGQGQHALSCPKPRLGNYKQARQCSQHLPKHTMERGGVILAIEWPLRTPLHRTQFSRTRRNDRVTRKVSPPPHFVWQSYHRTRFLLDQAIQPRLGKIVQIDPTRSPIGRGTRVAKEERHCCRMGDERRTGWWRDGGVH